MFEDKVLLKIRRKYSKDEAIAFLDKMVKELKFKNGELISENAELKFKLNQSEKERLIVCEQLKQRTKISKEDLIEERFKKQNQVISEHQRKLGEERKRAEYWQAKYYSLANRNEQIHNI